MSLLQSAATKVYKLPNLPAWLRQLSLGIGLIIIWQLYVVLFKPSPLLVTSPVGTVQALYTDILNGQLVSATLVSLQNLAIGMGIGIIIGLALASFSTFSRFGRDLLTVITSVLSPLPSLFHKLKTQHLTATLDGRRSLCRILVRFILSSFHD